MKTNIRRIKLIRRVFDGEDEFAGEKEIVSRAMHAVATSLVLRN